MRICLDEPYVAQRTREMGWESQPLPFNLIMYRLPLVIVSRRAWAPPTDVYETEDAVVVQLEIPGVSESDLEICLHERTLLISGRRVDPCLLEKTAYHRMEIQYGDFETEVHLSTDLAKDGMTAEYQNGFLTVRLPKAPAHRVAVQVED
jgi:HSP20 family molecular chaperone IbpA